MKNRYILSILMILLGGLAPAFDVKAQNPAPNAVDWIGRPWEYRYLIYSKTNLLWNYARELFEQKMLESPKDTGMYGQPLTVHFDPQFVLSIEKNPDRQLGVLRLDIQSDRTVVQPSLNGTQLRAR